MSDLLDVTGKCLNAICELPDGDRRRCLQALTALLDLTETASIVRPKQEPAAASKEKPAKRAPKGRLDPVVRDTCLKHASQPEGATGTTIERTAGIKRATAQYYLMRLQSQGLVEKRGRGNRARYHTT